MTRFRHLPASLADRLMVARERRVGRPIGERPGEDLRVMGELMAELLITAYHGIFHFGVEHEIFRPEELGLAPNQSRAFLREREEFRRTGRGIFIETATLDRLRANENLLEKFFQNWGSQNPFAQAFNGRLGGFAAGSESIPTLRARLRGLVERTDAFLRDQSISAAAAALEASTREPPESDPSSFLAHFPEGMYRRIFGDRAFPTDPVALPEFLGEAMAQALLRINASLRDAEMPWHSHARDPILRVRQWILDTMNLFRDLRFFPEILESYDAILARQSLQGLFSETEALPDSLGREILALIRGETRRRGLTPEMQALYLGNMLGLQLREFYLDSLVIGEFTGVLRAEDFGLRGTTLDPNRLRVESELRDDPLGNFSRRLDRLRATQALLDSWRNEWGTGHPVFIGLDTAFPAEIRENLRPGVERVTALVRGHRADRN